MTEQELQDFLAKGDNPPRPSPAQRRRIGLPHEFTAEYAAHWDPTYRAPYGRGSSVAFFPTRKELK